MNPTEEFEFNAVRNMANSINVGDKVNIFWETMALFNCEVLYMPYATGDSWRLRELVSLNTFKIHYVQTFCRMEKL